MPHDIPTSALTSALLELWNEILGESDPGGDTHVLDPGTGWVPSLASVDAAQASRPIAPGATSIAGQTAHAARALEYLEEILDGHEPGVDWPASFLPAEVDDLAWDRGRRRLRSAAERVSARLRGDAGWPRDHLLRVLSHLVHLAYHLGAVRQMVHVARG
jgi:hypothetical protein